MTASAKRHFTAIHISSIAGKGSKNPQWLLDAIARILDERADDLLEVMEVTGFEPQNISSMLHKSGSALTISIDALVENKDALASIIREGPFDRGSISSMLNGAGKNLADGIDALVKLPQDGSLSGIEKLKTVLAFNVEMPDGEKIKLFDARSVSSLLRGAGGNLASGIDALVENKEALAGIVREGIFDAKNLSSMLHGAGKDLAEGINAIVKNKEALAGIVQGGIFDATSISSMLNGSGRYLAAGINALVTAPEDGSPSGIEKLKAVLAFEIVMPDGSQIKLFDAKSISSMLGGGGRYLAEGIDALVKNKETLAEFVREGIFDAKSISSMLDRSGRYLAEGVDALVKNKEALAEIIREGTFDAKSISSMLAGAGKDLVKGIDALVRNKEALAAIVRKGTFDAKNLSSMLACAGKDLAIGMDALVKVPEDGSPSGIEKLTNVLAFQVEMPSGVKMQLFDAKSISSMLHNSGRDLAAGIVALVENQNNLAAIIRRGLFDSPSLSSMLHGVGKDLSIGVKAIESRLPKLEALCRLFDSTRVATRFNTVSAKNLGAEIDKMYNTYRSEIEGDTVVPPGTAGIAASNPAARTQREKL